MAVIPPQLKKLRATARPEVSSRAVDDAIAILKGDAKKEAAIVRAMEHADEGWVTLALAAIFRVASGTEYFTTDSVWMEGEGLPSPREPRAMGSVMRIAEKAGWIVPTRDHWLSKRPVCHRRPLRVWQSTLTGFTK
jgi:hypothetical protein